ncbi:hypothetical protein IJ103_03160, partial [Candidatus Saccharibacteria bacterium]|nr:hypothetical protein [Candidatus Saccharibacteria bacterium]
RRAHRDAGAGRGRTHSGLVATLLLVAAVGATSFVVYLANNGSAKRFAPVDAGDRTFYKEGGIAGVDWQPFEQSYALGYINLGESEQTRHCSAASSTRPNDPKNDVCKFVDKKTKKIITKKNTDFYIDYPGGAWYLGKKYDIREYIWSASGSCVPAVYVRTVRSWYPGSIWRLCSAITIREWHFYPPGTLGVDENGNFKTPSEEELARAEYNVSAGAEHGFRGVMRLDDFDGSCVEGYAVPIGNRGVWTTYNTQTAVRIASNMKGKTIGSNYISYDVYKWCGNSGHSTQATNPRTAMWVQFESTARNPDDPSDKGAPFTLAYYTTSHASSISSDRVTIRYFIYAQDNVYPQSVINAIKNMGQELANRAKTTADNNVEGECIPDEDIPCMDDEELDSGNSSGGGFFIGGGAGVEDEEDDGYVVPVNTTEYNIVNNNTIKQFSATLYGLYWPYFYYDELIDILPEGYTFDGWYDNDTGQKVDRDADSIILYRDHSYYGHIQKKTTPTTNPPSCYSDL